MPIKHKLVLDKARLIPALSNMVEEYDEHKALWHCCTTLVGKMKEKIDKILADK